MKKQKKHQIPRSKPDLFGAVSKSARRTSLHLADLWLTLATTTKSINEFVAAVEKLKRQNAFLPD